MTRYLVVDQATQQVLSEGLAPVSVLGKLSLPDGAVVLRLPLDVASPIFGNTKLYFQDGVIVDSGEPIVVDSYAVKRRREYPPVGDYLDAVVSGDPDALEAYIEKCRAVKRKYPKEE